MKLLTQVGPEDLLRASGKPHSCCGYGNLPGFEPEKLLVVLALATALLAPRMLHAQAEPAGIGPGSYTSLGFTASSFNSGYGQQKLAGGTLYLDGNLYRRVGFEAEARSLRFHATEDVRQNTLLAGPRFSARGYNFRPYTKLLAGVSFMQFPYGDAHGRYLVLAPGGGIDYRIRHTPIQVRILDVEYQYWPRFNFGPLRTWGISSGLSLRVW